MTSKENNEETIKFLEKNNYFGYDKDYITIFTQSELPLVDEQGKLLIGKDYMIKEASDGNGGTYTSLRTSGCLAEMKEKGIKWIFIGSVDNALLKMVDVTLLGMAIEKISQETLMYHHAHKKNSYIDENGNEIIPTEPNSYKFESFIFDAFEFFDDIAILRGRREDDFAPVKNKDGVDSPKTAKELYEKYWNNIK